MNYNVITYLIYLIATVIIIVYVGRLFYQNGRLFILALFKGDAETADRINRLLLVAYYLFNIGYAFLRLRFWQQIHNPGLMISSLSSKIGILILILATTHYFNMLTIYLLSTKKITFLTNKHFQS